MLIFKTFVSWVKEDKLTAISTALCFMAVALISIVRIEGIILMILSQIGWTIWAFRKSVKFMIIQNTILMVIDLYGVYYWITSGKGTWAIKEVLQWLI